MEADLVIHNARIYTVDSSFSVAEAIAIKDGMILKTGTDEIILNEFKARETKDAKGKFIFPGFIDAHCHFLNYGLGLKQAGLAGTKSFNEVIEKVAEFSKTNKDEWIIGRGWDQNDWVIKGFPDRRRLDSLFPNTPVILTRIDGHAALVNGEALKRAAINHTTEVPGGEIQKYRVTRLPQNMNDLLSGILIDNAVELVTNKIPLPSKEQLKQALLSAQKNCLAVGLTTIDDAGLKKYEIDVIDDLQKKKELKMRVYAMLTPDKENLDHYLKNGIYKTDYLNVRSFKFYADGALGSRGACLLSDYNDQKDWKGFLLNEEEYFEENADLMREKGFQMNTHCIGDSAVRLISQIYGADSLSVIGGIDEGVKSEAAKRRWRIEHAQVIDKNDFKYFDQFGIIPSVQPTHATSDMYWVEKRLGKERIKYAYAYKALLKAAGMLALGTDFPVEDISPFKTFYAAVYRKDAKGFPEGGFQMENALTREETIKGMTIWAAYSNFEEKEKGSLEKGKFADLLILDTDLMKCKEDQILRAKVLSAFIGGEEVFKQ
jgi:predicted amidohydrolase YtcJ